MGIITALGYLSAGISAGVDGVAAIQSLVSKIQSAQAAGRDFTLEDAEQYGQELGIQEGITQAAINKARDEDNSS